MDLRTACLRYDLEMAMERGGMDPPALLQLELNELTPEQNDMLLQHQLQREAHAKQHKKP